MAKNGRSTLLLLAVFAAGIGLGALSGDVLAWRARAYSKKVLGILPELRWSEIVEMTIPTDAYGLSGSFREGKSLDASITNPHTSDPDVREGERLFSKHCAMCHGADAGGSTGPSLRRTSYSHGDSSFAIYRVLRDGIQQTAMVAPPLDAKQRWQMVAYLRDIQQGKAARFASSALSPINVSNERLISAGSRTDEWITYSGRLKGWRYSKLNQLTPENVSQLKLVWKRQFTSDVPAQLSTPLAVDGRLFVSESPSNVVAINARTGDFLWRYEHPLPKRLPVCCGPVNRGVALYGDLVYIGTLDGKLVALDALTGAVRWRAQVASPANGITINVAPLAFKGLVVVGVSGGEYGIRGCIVAYDAASGKEQWRFNTIPGPGEPGHETWGPGEAWETGGGPTWVTGSYDPDLDLLYWGVGNPVPEFQGAGRPGDNLFTESVLAIRPSTGKLIWHFQFTPHDEHDWDSNQTPILAELEIDGKLRRVICWANRNGYYYVLDRETGKFLKGVPFVRQNWSEGLDSNGRPILASSGKQSATGRRTFPGVSGGTNWYPAAFDPGRSLVFIHANDQSTIFTQAPADKLKRRPNEFYLGSGGAATDEPNFSVRAVKAATGEIVWIHPEVAPTAANGITGLLATAGGLVFGGTGGRVFALESSTGREAWGRFLGGNTQAPPITFSLDGRQVLAVWSGRTLSLFAL